MTLAGGKILPRVDFTQRTESGGVTERATAAAVATPAADRQLTVAAEHAPLRTVYGQDRLGAQIANVAVSGNDWIIHCVWCAGEIDSINELTLNDEVLPAGAVAAHYTGTTTQTADPTLAAAITGYDDALPGIAYTVLKVPASALDGFPQIAATIKGQLLYDPRTLTTAWSNNPALALRDFVVRATGRSVDEASVGVVADACDALVSGEKRRTLGLTLDTVQDVSRWLDTLRTYASCWLTLDGDVVKFVADRPRTTDATITHAAGQIQSLSLKKRGIRSVPTVVRVRYTNTSAIPWRDDWVEADSGDTPRRESEVPLPGIHSASAAYREAVERLNKQRLCDLSADLDVFDEALAFEVGDVIEVTHPAGLVAKPMRVLGVAGDYGRWRLGLTEYDPAVYSDAVAPEPTFADTTLPSPANPPALTGLTLTEEVYQLENGTYASRIKAVWDAAVQPYLISYRFEVWALGTPIYTTTTREAIARTPAVQEGMAYTVKVAAVSSIGAVGEFATDSLTAAGKYLIPGDVPSISAFEAGGRVYASWTPAADLDIWRYEVRYGTGGWDSATLIDRVDALRLQSDQIPVGTWTLYVKALDSVGQYSPNAATVSVTVTSDASAFLIDTYEQTAPTLTSMAEYDLGPTDSHRYFVTEDGVAFGTRFSGTLDGYTDALATYHGSVTSTWLGEAEDFGLLLGGQWTGTATVAALSGTQTSAIGFSDDGSAYTYTAGLTHKVNSRFARMKHEAETTSTLLVTIPTQTIRLDAIPREEVGSGTSSASGPVTITLENEYVATKKITITAEGTTARMATYDNVIVGTPTSFDVYVFDTAGNKIASPFRYTYQGV